MLNPYENAFSALGGDWVDPAMILPAALPLDLCGEAIRSRLCIFTDHNNQDWALRPDVTLPLALEEIENRKRGQLEGPHHLRYAARVFRQPTKTGLTDKAEHDYIQLGFERFGEPSTPQLDGETYQLVSEQLKVQNVAHASARFGDLSIVPSFIAALDFAPSVKAGLERAFREKGGVQAYLKRLAIPSDNAALSLSETMAKADKAHILSDYLAAQNIPYMGARSLDEIATRLIEQKRDQDKAHISKAAWRVLEEVIAIDCPMGTAVDRLQQIARQADLSGLDPVLQALATRLEIIQTTAPTYLDAARFGTGFGRRFMYYDGFVFEIADLKSDGQSAYGTGGRYDSLLSNLSRGAVELTAIGGVIRPDLVTSNRAEAAR